MNHFHENISDIQVSSYFFHENTYIFQRFKYLNFNSNNCLIGLKSNRDSNILIALNSNKAFENMQQIITIVKSHTKH